MYALREEGDKAVYKLVFRGGNFYPRPPRGGRLVSGHAEKVCKRFLSTPSARRATLCSLLYTFSRTFLSTPSARRATDTHVMLFPVHVISIHALREEGDGARNLAPF